MVEIKNKPHGWWGVASNTTPSTIVIAGGFKNGVKKKRWWSIDCWTIFYNSKGLQKITHSAFGC